MTISFLRLGVPLLILSYGAITVFYYSMLLLTPSWKVTPSPSSSVPAVLETEGHSPLSLAAFLGWASQIASDDKEILLMYASGDYETMAHNCILSLHRLGVHNAAILTIDNRTERYFHEHKIPVYNVANIQDIPKDVQLSNDLVSPTFDISRLKHKDWASRWNSPTTKRWPHWMLRHYLALQVLKAGYGVYQTDVDMVFTANPYSWLDPEADLEGQTQHWPRQNALNLGIGHVASTTGGILHWETTNNLMRYLGDDPQSIENFMLLDALYATVGRKESRPCRKELENVLCEWMISPMIKTRRWPESLLPMGYQLYNPRKPRARSKVAWHPESAIGVHVHATVSDYQLGKTAMYEQWTRHQSLWFIPNTPE
jgi:hypothetical protein